MNPLSGFLPPASPGLCVVNLPLTEMYDLMVNRQREHRTVAYRLLRGHKCETDAALFDEFAAGLQFPYYFGQNWSAFDECCRDIGDIYRQPHCAIVGNAHCLLKSSDVSLRIFTEILNRVIVDSCAPGREFGLSLILQSDGAVFGELRTRLMATGVPFEECGA